MFYYQLLQAVTKIDSPNGGDVFRPEKVTIYGSFLRGHDLKNLVVSLEVRVSSN